MATLFSLVWVSSREAAKQPPGETRAEKASGDLEQCDQSWHNRFKMAQYDLKFIKVHNYQVNISITSLNNNKPSKQKSNSQEMNS